MQVRWIYAVTTTAKVDTNAEKMLESFRCMLSKELPTEFEIVLDRSRNPLVESNSSFGLGKDRISQ